MERVAAERSARYLGRREQVLAEGINPRDPGQLMGRTRTNRLTFFAADPGDGRPYAPGDLVDVLIEAVRPFSLSGRPLGREPVH